MRWPFTRRPIARAEPEHVVEPATRRDWVALPPLIVAGHRPIQLTATPDSFVDGLATRQTLVRAPRLEHLRSIDSPSGALRGVLAAPVDDRPAADGEPVLASGSSGASPLPPIEHRRVSSMPGEAAADPNGTIPGASFESPIDRLLALDEPSAPNAADRRPEPRVDPHTGSATEAADVVGQAGRRRSGLADSRRRGLGPAYHGPLPEAINAERLRDQGQSADQPSAGHVTREPVPDGVRATMRDLLGVDVGDRVVHRGPVVSAEAQSMGAEAFTRDGEVYVADHVGPLDELRGRATLAHELTHAAQQAVHGSRVDESSTAGQIHEAHARRVEQFVRGDGGAIKPSPELLHARPPAGVDSVDADLAASTRQMMRALVDTGFARPDGDGGIVFTMPPSAMTATGGTQRLTSSASPAQPGEAARQENWDAGAVFGNTLAQGLGNDLISLAGSAFGFSDELVGEQRGELADANREFGREQTRRAFVELRMEHLRTARLEQRNAEETLLGLDRTMALDDETLRTIDRTVHDEVEQRMRLLDGQRDRALQQLNDARRASRDTPLTEVPDASYDVAFHRLFDQPESDDVPTEDELLTLLKQAPATGGSRGAAGPRASGAAARPPGPIGAPSSGPTASAVTGSASASSTGSPTSSPSGSADEADQPWRTSDTVSGRFSALGSALVADIAHDQIETIGSLFGFDEQFEHGIHDDIDASARAEAPSTATATDTASAAPRESATRREDTAVADGAAHPARPAAHETVDEIVGDPYALDELATRLYPNIRSLLRSELLIDRERAGLLADFR
ncbi:MAG: DUF4157 domain-containing protein [Ilumatobacteraceae bacterium]